MYEIRIRLMLFLALLLAVVLLVSGCAECKGASDCQAQGSCFAAKCVDKKCVQDPKPNCCGNDIPEIIEDGLQGNKCTCPTDYGSCSGSVQGTKYLAMLCNKAKTECASNIKPGMQQYKSFTNEIISPKGIQLKLTTSLNLPFNVDKDIFNVQINLLKENRLITEVKIKKIELVAINMMGETIYLGEKEVDKKMWTIDSEIEEGIVINPKSRNIEEKMAVLTIRISMEYVQEIAGQEFRDSDLVENTYAFSFEYVNPQMTPECPETCDDNNPATDDICSAQTGYFCLYLPQRGTCGNYDCEPGEDKCTCAEDCGPCAGTTGSYLEWFCHEDKCSTRMVPSLNPESQTEFEERNLNLFTLTTKYTVNRPFDVNKDIFVIDYELSQITASVSAPKITTVRIIEGTKLLAEKEVNAGFSSVGSKQRITIPVGVNIHSRESQKAVVVKVWYEYKLAIPGQDPQTLTGKYEKSLGTIFFIDPDVSFRETG